MQLHLQFPLISLSGLECGSLTSVSGKITEKIILGVTGKTSERQCNHWLQTT